MFELQRLGARARGEIQQVRRCEQHAFRREALERVCLQRFLEDAEAGSPADVGSECTMNSRVDVAAQREDAAAQHGVAAWDSARLKFPLAARRSSSESEV